MLLFTKRIYKYSTILRYNYLAMTQVFNYKYFLLYSISIKCARNHGFKTPFAAILKGYFRNRIGYDFLLKKKKKNM